jgi:hypothetical protein
MSDRNMVPTRIARHTKRGSLPHDPERMEIELPKRSTDMTRIGDGTQKSLPKLQGS